MKKGKIRFNLRELQFARKGMSRSIKGKRRFRKETSMLKYVIDRSYYKNESNSRPCEIHDP